LWLSTKATHLASFFHKAGLGDCPFNLLAETFFVEVLPPVSTNVDVGGDRPIGRSIDTTRLFLKELTIVNTW
jgi:hypothetical protein